MAKRRTRINPFYVVLLIVGIAFTITACAYGVMLLRSDRRGRGDPIAQSSELMIFLQDRGAELLTGELLVLGIATIGAIWLDGVWARRAQSAITNTPTQVEDPS